MQTKPHDMRIPVTSAVMKTNPKFDFYSTLFRLMRSESFLRAEAKRLVLMANDYPEITMPGVTLENLEEWYEKYSITGSEKEEFAIMETITDYCFADLAAQMRNESVQQLFLDWKSGSGIPDDLFVHVRKSTDLGNGISSATIVVDDMTAFRRFYNNQDIRTSAHFSESEVNLWPSH